MRMKTWTTIALIAVVAVTARAEDKSAAKIESVHYVLITDGQEKAPVPPEQYKAEIWAKGEKQRMEVFFLGKKSISISDGQMSYFFREGDKLGGVAARKRGQFQMDVELLGAARSGPKLGVEQVKGDACDKYEYKDGSMVKTVWISQKTGFFSKISFELPVQTREITIITQTYTDVAVNGDLSDALFTPPEDVKFIDMADYWKSKAPAPAGK